MAISKKAQAAKDAALAGTGKTTSKNGAVAFLNWSVPLKNGGALRSEKGFPIFQNPEYPNDKEDKLIELAKKYGGSVTLKMDVRIVLNGYTPDNISVDDILV